MTDILNDSIGENDPVIAAAWSRTDSLENNENISLTNLDEKHSTFCFT